MNDIKILTIISAPAGNLCGYFDVEIGGIIVRKCRIVQQPGMRAYISGPQMSSGPKRWFTFVTFPDHIRQAIQDQVLPRTKEMGMTK
jgi:hypothetical protein